MCSTYFLKHIGGIKRLCCECEFVVCLKLSLRDFKRLLLRKYKARAPEVLLLLIFVAS